MSLTVRTLGAERTSSLLIGPGLRLQTGPFVAHLRTRLPDVCAAFSRLYADYKVVGHDEFADFQVEVRRPPGLRRWWKPQVSFVLDGYDPFNPLPGDQGFPLLEWGLNWCIYGMCHQYLILHAAVLERNGRALLLPAPSGSGKSTLCAALLFNGWRLLSDELALISPQGCELIPNPRPISLKNDSIDIIAALVPGLQFGSRVSETSKGVVAHFAAPSSAVQQAHRSALPGWVVLPRYTPGAATSLVPLERARALLHLVENAFNYDVFGQEGFMLLAETVGQSDCFTFEYSNLSEAIETFDRLASRPPTPLAPSMGLHQGPRERPQAAHGAAPALTLCAEDIREVSGS
jgi:HprK-related kinase A